MTNSAVEVVPSEAALSQIMAAIRRLNQKRAVQPNPPRDGSVYSGCRMCDILSGVLHEITPVIEPFTRGEARAALDVLVGQGKITLVKSDPGELYTVKVC